MLFNIAQALQALFQRLLRFRLVEFCNLFFHQVRDELFEGGIPGRFRASFRLLEKLFVQLILGPNICFPSLPESERSWRPLAYQSARPSMEASGVISNSFRIVAARSISLGSVVPRLRLARRIPGTRSAAMQ